MGDGDEEKQQQTRVIDTYEGRDGFAKLMESLEQRRL